MSYPGHASWIEALISSWIAVTTETLSSYQFVEFGTKIMIFSFIRFMMSLTQLQWLLFSMKTTVFTLFLWLLGLVRKMILSLISFYGISTNLRLFYALTWGNCVFTFLRILYFVLTKCQNPLWLFCPVGLGYRIHQQLLWWGVRPYPNEYSRYDTKQSDGKAIVMLELWGM